MTGYTLIRAKRRTMSLQLDRDGRAVVRAPYGVKKEFIDRFVAEHEGWLTRAREKQQARRLAHPEPTDEERKALIARAKEYLPMRVDYWSGIMGLTPTGLKITSARTRFGSCSGKNSLCFSWRLMQYPREAIDYVVVHELAHNFGLAGNPDSKSEAGELIVGGISTAGKIAVVLGLVVMLVVVILNLPKKEEAKA